MKNIINQLFFYNYLYFKTVHKDPIKRLMKSIMTYKISKNMIQLLIYYLKINKVI